MRRLRPLLPEEAGGRGYRRHLFHPCLLQASRCRALRLQGLSEAFRTSSGLRPPDAGQCPDLELVAAELRLSSWSRKGATSIGGIRWFPAILIPSMRPASRCAAGSSGSEDEIPDSELEDHIVPWPAGCRSAPGFGNRRRVDRSPITNLRFCIGGFFSVGRCPNAGLKR